VIGPCKRHAYFIGPDGKADPETVLFAAAHETFVRPIDALNLALLKTLVAKCTQSFPDATMLWSPSSILNRTWRQKKQVPHYGKQRKDSDTSDDD
jgi:hypothetical protein